jgi:hypothetical protein
MRQNLTKCCLLRAKERGGHAYRSGGRTMKPVYLGAVRGYQSPVYRPGMGWSTSDTGRQTSRGSAVFTGRKSAHVCPFAVVERRNTGLRTKAAIIAVLVAVAALLALLFGGIAQF